MNKLVYDQGVYEKGIYPGWVNGRATKVYRLWEAMLSRCQPGGLYQQKYPSYVGCEVHPDFIKFQDFATWCQTQIGFGVDGFVLDKDILAQDNKVYGPDTCVFVPHAVNKLVSCTLHNQGGYPIGVCWHKRLSKYQANISIDNVRKHIGYFETPEEASTAYKTAKYEEIRRLANLWKPKIGRQVYFTLLQYKLKGD